MKREKLRDLILSAYLLRLVIMFRGLGARSASIKGNACSRLEQRCERSVKQCDHQKVRDSLYLIICIMKDSRGVA